MMRSEDDEANVIWLYIRLAVIRGEMRVK